MTASDPGKILTEYGRVHRQVKNVFRQLEELHVSHLAAGVAPDLEDKEVSGARLLITKELDAVLDLVQKLKATIEASH
jgi:hypothetical protein